MKLVLLLINLTFTSPKRLLRSKRILNFLQDIDNPFDGTNLRWLKSSYENPNKFISVLC